MFTAKATFAAFFKDSVTAMGNMNVNDPPPNLLGSGGGL
jgi:hypothetical protein